MYVATPQSFWGITGGPDGFSEGVDDKRSERYKRIVEFRSDDINRVKNKDTREMDEEGNLRKRTPTSTSVEDSDDASDSYDED